MAINKNKFQCVKCGVVFLAYHKTNHRPRQFCSKSCASSYKFWIHGEAINKTPEYRAWANMVKRCTNPKDPRWKDYGGRGITVFNEWIHSYSAFLSYIGRRPSSKHSIDRYPDNNGNYEPGNVRWATPKDQSRNTRVNRLISFKGEVKCLVDWAKELKVSYQALQRRLRRGIPLDGKKRE